MTDFNLEIKKDKKEKVLRKVIFYSILVIWAIIVLFPFYWMILTSVKSYAAFSSEQVPKFFVFNPTFENYTKAFTEVKLLRYCINTAFFSIITTAIMMFITILSAFAFSRLEFKGKRIVFTLLLALMMIPSELVIITNYYTIQHWHLTDNYLGIILPSVASVFYIYLLKENFESIPDALYEAAKVDGTTDWRYLWKVMVPIAKPTVVSILILKIIECWNSYVWPRLITKKEDFFLIAQGIQEIRQNGFGREDIPTMMAAVVVVSIPIIILFILFRKQIMSGVSKTGIKG